MSLKFALIQYEDLLVECIFLNVVLLPRYSSNTLEKQSAKNVVMVPFFSASHVLSKEGVESPALKSCLFG